MGEGTSTHADKLESGGNADYPRSGTAIHGLFWLWVGLCLIYTLVIAPLGCINSLMAATAYGQRGQDFVCLTGAVVGIPIGFFNGLGLLIAGIIIRRTKKQQTRLGAWVFIMISMLIYLPPTTSGFFLGWPFDEFWTVVLSTAVHHGLLTALILLLWRVSNYASATGHQDENAQQDVNTYQQL